MILQTQLRSIIDALQPHVLTICSRGKKDVYRKSIPMLELSCDVDCCLYAVDVI